MGQGKMWSKRGIKRNKGKRKIAQMEKGILLDWRYITDCVAGCNVVI